MLARPSPPIASRWVPLSRFKVREREGRLHAHANEALQVQLVPQLVISHRARQEPGVAVVERPRLELDAIERRAAFGTAEDLLGDAGAEIARQRDAGAAIAHAVIDPVILPAQVG